MYSTRYTCPMCCRAWYYVDGEVSMIGGEGPDEGDYCLECGYGDEEVLRGELIEADEDEDDYGVGLVPLFPVKEFIYDYLPFTVQYCEQPAWLEEAGKRGPIPTGVFTAVVRAFWRDMVDITGRI
jgi:hypothetical protein